LHSIRFRGVDAKAGNEQHPADDPLWDEPEVVDLYVYGTKLTAEGKKQRVKERNKANYERSKERVGHLKEALPALLAENKISESTVLAKFIKHQHAE
jgi:hypothetical protein